MPDVIYIDLSLSVLRGGGVGFVTVEMPVLQLASDKVNPDVWPFSYIRDEELKNRSEDEQFYVVRQRPPFKPAAFVK